MDEKAQLLRFGVRIRDAREKIGMSQENLAIQISRTQFAVSEYENGKRRIYAHDLPTLARALQVPVTYFFEEKTEPELHEELILTEFRNLPNQSAREFAIDFIRGLGNLIEKSSSE